MLDLKILPNHLVLPATTDFMFALISNDELEQAGQMMVKQLKNRYNDPTMNKKFVIGRRSSKNETI